VEAKEENMRLEEVNTTISELKFKKKFYKLQIVKLELKINLFLQIVK